MPENITDRILTQRRKDRGHWSKSMDALIDTNVLITYVTNRNDPYRESSVTVMELCAGGKINGSIAFHSLSTLWYVLRKYPEKERRDWLLQIVNLLEIAVADNDAVREAVEMDDFKDFEDCLQYFEKELGIF